MATSIAILLTRVSGPTPSRSRRSLPAGCDGRRWSVLGALAVLVLCSGCVSTRYTGERSTPTEHVAVFHDASEVRRPYAPMGVAESRASASLPLHAVEADLVREAKSRGADAIIIIDDQIVVIGQTAGDAEDEGEVDVEERVVEARLIRYTDGGR